jgi:hypothetical protein
MTWAKLDDRLYDDPRCEAAGLDAMGLFVMALSYMGAYLTDGWITVERVRRLAGPKRGVWLADRLVQAGWWERPEDGAGAFRLVGWEAYLIPREAAEERSQRAADAGRKGGRARTRNVPAEQPPHEPAANLPPNHASTPGDACRGSEEVASGNVAKALESPQATRAPDPDPTRPDPNSAHARSRGDVEGQALLFRPLDPPGDPPPPAAEELPPPPKPRRMPAKAEAAPKVPTAAERYAAAYVDGFAAEGHTITPPTKSEAGVIGRVCATHARYTDGTPITGEALERWIRKQARRFVSNVDGSRHAGGYSAFGFRRFCDDNPPDKPRPPGEAPPSPPAPLERPVYTPEQQALADRFQRMARGEGRAGAVIDG